MDEKSVAETILQFDMTPQQAKAFKIAVMYIEKARQFFPKEWHQGFSKRGGDPRKSLAFKHAFKLVRETERMMLEDKDYKLYVHAQFDILRHISDRDGVHPNIMPNILTGPQAWRRWMLWRMKYDKVKNFARSSEVVVDIQKEKKVLDDLRRTKAYLFVQFDRHDPQDVRAAIEDGQVFVWLSWGKICYHYFLLSPIVQKWLEETKIDLLKKHSIDLKMYAPGITPGVLELFRKEFAYEFPAEN